MNVYVDTCAKSLNKSGEELCGDTVEVLRSGGKVTVVLADGLGSGVKANILATLTGKIAATMLNGGADIAEVVETVASTLPVCRERGIAYSTFTILQVENNGAARLVEFDNPEAVLMRGGQAIELKKKALQFDRKVILESRFCMSPGDACILFSDGAVHAGVGRLLNFGWQRENIVEYLRGCCKSDLPARMVTGQLLGACNSLYMEQPGDDTTVVTVKVCTEQPCMALIGPPVNPDADCALVDRLMRFPGKKVICGGTTSQIVSRLAGRELKVDLSYVSPDVPPVGSIDGVDLVTEGLITLGKACGILEQCMRSQTEDPGRILNGRDGASMLAKLLLEECNTIYFVVGRALNPIYQNPEVPYDAGVKSGLVQRMAGILKECGKKVFIEYS